jgi:hypothetical protein
MLLWIVFGSFDLGFLVVIMAGTDQDRIITFKRAVIE